MAPYRRCVVRQLLGVVHLFNYREIYGLPTWHRAKKSSFGLRPPTRSQTQAVRPRYSAGVFAEFERGIIRERVNAGLARARQNGTKLGRRRVKPSVEATIREQRAKGDGILKIARTLGSRPGWNQ